MHKKTKNTTRETQTSDSAYGKYQNNRDVIARLLAKLLVKMYLKRGTNTDNNSKSH